MHPIPTNLSATPPATNDDIAALDAAVATALPQHRPVNTRASYASDWTMWVQFCGHSPTRSVDPATLSPGLLEVFVRWMHLERGNSVSTMRRRLSGVLAGLRALHGPDAVPSTIATPAHTLITRIERDMAEQGHEQGRGPAVAVTLHELRGMCAAQPDSLAGLRNALLLVLMGKSGNRSAEMVSLTSEDLVDEGQRLVLRVRWSKNGPKQPIIDATPDSDLCPVRLLRLWLGASGITQGPLFRGVTRHGTLRPTAITTRMVRRIVTEAAEASDLSRRVSPHSLRAFMATVAYEHGVDPLDIAIQGGWSADSREMWRYVRRVQQRRFNASSPIAV